MEKAPIRMKEKPPTGVRTPNADRGESGKEPLVFDYGEATRSSPVRWLVVCLLLMLLTATVFALHQTTSVADTVETTGETIDSEENGRVDTTASADASTEVGAPPEAAEQDFYFYNPNTVPEGYLGIRPMDLSGDGMRNETLLTLDENALASAFVGESSIDPYAPLVLILHTHSCESYLSSAEKTVRDGVTIGRSENREENVLAVGRVLQEALISLGIPTLHCEILHDRVDGRETYVGAYDRSNETVLRYLALYPSIRYVIDLHRDAVFDGNGDVVRPITVVNGEAVAQVLMVVGSGEGVDHERNLSLALALNARLNGDEARLCRQVLLRDSLYGQAYPPYALLLEIGSVGNSLDEAKRAALLVANALAELIRGERGGTRNEREAF